MLFETAPAPGAGRTPLEIAAASQVWSVEGPPVAESV